MDTPAEEWEAWCSLRPWIRASSSLTELCDKHMAPTDGRFYYFQVTFSDGHCNGTHIPPPPVQV